MPSLLQRNCNVTASTWKKNQFIECNIMVQKYLAMVVILGAIAALSIGMVTTGQVKAFERTCHFWSNGDMQCENGPFFGYTQHPTVQGVYYDSGGNYYTCPWNGCPDNKAAIIQPQLQEIAYTPTNCFWSYPVQCN